MKKRITIFLALCAIHLLTIYWDKLGPLAPLGAGSIYLPLMGLDAVGLPVFSGTGSGGWQSPNALGWSFVSLLWASVWWAVSGAFINTRGKRRRNA